MRSGKKLDLLKESMMNLIGVLRDIDNVSLISYAQEPTILIESISGADKDAINNRIQGLTAAGITNGVKGLNSAFDLAQRKFISNGNNQVILATDGEFTGGKMNAEEIRLYIKQQAQAGIVLSIIGFGVDSDAQRFMVKMARSGKGTYIHVSKQDDVSDIFVDEIKAKSKIRR